MLSDFPNDFSSMSGPSPSDEGARAPVIRKDIRVVFSWFILIITLLLLLVAYGANVYLSGFDRFGLTITGQIQGTEAQITQLEEHIQLNTIEELILFEKQIATVKDLTLSRAGYAPLFNVLSEVILDAVTFESASFQLNQDSYTVLVSAVAEDPYTYLQQLAVIQNSDDPLVQKIQLGSYDISRDDRGRSTVSFSLSMAVPIDDLQQSSAPAPAEDEPYDPFDDVQIPGDSFGDELP